ncbi:hypothetical protein GOQ27_08400 [Clostridium sp. D2Q-11]|uniref:Uncharacterized protein n=1 Tax=Anaeromonas frigoriresistens TaxID=2683708 RepID=A0A942UTV4_9FIRM|nr:hypothetical protein [Anaeromonas frigoriresistens]MBS4538483.1 hypothetical protein [Anaeromonas frigoriresistens]
MRKKIWISYLKDNKKQYFSLLQEYRKGLGRIKEIIENAKEETTDWKKVIEIYNRRFYVSYWIKEWNIIEMFLYASVIK